MSPYGIQLRMPMASGRGQNAMLSMQIPISSMVRPALHHMAKHSQSMRTCELCSSFRQSLLFVMLHDRKRLECRYESKWPHPNCYCPGFAGGISDASRDWMVRQMQADLQKRKYSELHETELTAGAHDSCSATALPLTSDEASRIAREQRKV